VTTVNTDPLKRARIAAKILHVFNRPDIPVSGGEREMFDGSPTRCKYINGAVVLILDDPVPTGKGIDLMIEMVLSNPGEITIIGIGCWTNIAKAFQLKPDLSKLVRRLILMGGKIIPPGVESNINCDPAAANYVFSLPLKKMLVPLDVTAQCRYRAAQHGKLITAGNSRTRLIRDFIRVWQIGRHAGNTAYEPTLHDPLTVALSFDSTLITSLEPMHLKVEFREGLPVTEPVARVEPAKVVDYLAGVTIMIGLRHLGLPVEVTSPTPRETFFGAILGRWADGFNAIRPELATAAAFIDPGDRKMEIAIDGVGKEVTRTSDYLVDFRQVISFITKEITLLPGDVVSLGPAGKTLMIPAETRLINQARIRVEIDELGEFSVPVIDRRQLVLTTK
jgi:purine nucleosidase